MKLSWETLAWVALVGVVLFGAYSWWDAVRFRNASYSCSEGPKEIALTFAGIPYLESFPYSGEFSLTGVITSGAATVSDFPGVYPDPYPSGPRKIRFSAGGDRISREHNGEWYDAPTLVRFEPDTEEAICNFRIVYRMTGLLG